MFQKGQSGNPGGRPKALKEVEALARAHTPAAMQALFDIVTGNHPAAARVSAASVILDRGWGKAMQPTEITGADGGDLKGSFTVTFVKASAH